MKMIKKIKVIKFLLVLLIAIAPNDQARSQKINNFYFEDAQPRKIDRITRFPQTFRGMYVTDKDSLRRFTIVDDSIYFELPMVQVASRTELEEKNYTVTDSMITAPNNESFRCFIQNDTVFFADYVKSVLFVVNENNVIKKSGETLILNRKLENNFWECFLIYKENDKLCLAYFDFGKKHDELNEHKRIKPITIGSERAYSGNLKEKDFQKLINGDYFPDKHYFTKRFSL